MYYNKNYGRLEEQVISYAPDRFRTDRGIIINPPEYEYILRGWKPIYHSDCPYAYGEEYWEQDEYAIYQRWREVDPPAPDPTAEYAEAARILLGEEEA